MPVPPRIDQEQRFVELVLANPVCGAVVSRLPELDLPDCWLVGGALFQTVWNGLSGRVPTAGIRDYDVFFFDPDDLSWEREDRAIQQAAALFGDLPTTVEVRNEARVHLWYESHFGQGIAPFVSSRDAVDHFVGTTCCLALRPDPSAGFEVHASHGFDDLFAMRLRPNPRLAARATYDRKAARWSEEWPALQVEPWPGPDG